MTDMYITVRYQCIYLLAFIMSEYPLLISPFKRTSQYCIILYKVTYDDKQNQCETCQRQLKKSLSSLAQQVFRVDQ